MVAFTWAGFDETDEVTSDGSADLLDDGSIEIAFAYCNGDEAVLNVRPDRGTIRGPATKISAMVISIGRSSRLFRNRMTSGQGVLSL